MRTFQRTLERTGVLQVDSVNVLQRAHFMPLYSRMGPYDVDLLRRAAEQRPRRVVEYWAHVQAFMPVELWPVMQHRMDDYRAKRGKWGFVAANDAPRAQPARRGRRPRRLDRPRPRRRVCPRAKDNWGWNWSETRRMLDYLFTVGTGGDRRAQQPVRDPLRPARAGDPRRRARAADARRARRPRRELVRRAARSHGVATVQDLRDYYRMPVARHRDRRRRRWSRTGELRPGVGRRAGSARPTCTATPGCRDGSPPGRC